MQLSRRFCSVAVPAGFGQPLVSVVMARSAVALLWVVVGLTAACSDTATQDGKQDAAGQNDLGNTFLDGQNLGGTDASGLEIGPTDCEFPADPLPGQAGAKCSENKDCATNLCVSGPEGKICSTQCVTCCPSGFACGQNSTGSDTAFVCLPRLGALCRPCKADAECEAENVGARCVDYGVDGKFCGGTCSADTDCPAEFACVDAGGSKQCKRTTGICGCSEDASADNASTICGVSNTFGVCPGTRSCGASGLSACGGTAAKEEVCNGQDDNCDGTTDEGAGDFDNDKLGDCQDPDDDNDGTPDEQDCAPLNKDIHKEATEKCDGVDDDCDGQTDDGPGIGCKSWYQDADLDGFGWGAAQCLCGPQGVYTAKTATDCDDGSKTVAPGLEEICGNGLDDDCDAAVDEWDGTIGCSNFYVDGDGDGWGSGAPVCQCGAGGPAKSAKTGDCNDKDGKVFPDATESCNTVDDDCNGVTDEDDAVGCTPYYVDADKDGYGSAAQAACLCKPNDAFAAASPGDCNDDAKSVNPGADEACGGGDEDCDGSKDEAGATGCQTWYYDGDGDTYGSSQSQCLCAPGNGFEASTSTDCNDANKTAYPNAPELCNGLDDDCDDLADDGFGLGLGCGSGQGSCIATGKIVCKADGSGSYCSANAVPGTAEACNNADDDCDGSTDEGCDDDGDDWCDSALGFQNSTACPNGGGDCQDDKAAVHPGVTEVCNGVDDDCSGQTDGMTQACSNGCNSGNETCVAGNWQGCDAAAPECTTGPCCDGCKFRPSSFECGTSPASVTQDCSGTCGGGITQTEQWQYCTGTSSTCGSSNLKSVSKGIVQSCDGDSLCKDAGATATCQACTNGCGAGACLTQTKTVVCIDAGYGGTEPGGISSDGVLVEKTLNLDYALKLKEWLDKDSADPAGGGNWQVVMTRTTDATVTQAARVATCNNANAGRVLSLYTNDLADTTANGVESFILEGLGLSSASYKFCLKVQNEVVAATGLFNRGVKTGAYTILKSTNAPACLTLPGFIDNPTDKVKLGSATARKAIALGLLKALQKEFGLTAYEPK